MIEYEMRSKGISNLSKNVKSINEPKNLLIDEMVDERDMDVR